jgi:hypothetical protein
MVSMLRSKKKKSGFRRTLQIVLLAAVVYFFVLPLIPGFRQAVKDLARIDPYLLIVGLGLQSLSL